MPVLDGVTYFSKQHALDHIAHCAKKKIPIRAVEVVKIDGGNIETSLFKTIWFNTQRAVYRQAKNFVMQQMGGEWNWCEVKN